MMHDSGAIPYFSVSSRQIGADAAFQAFALSIQDMFSLTRLGPESGYHTELTAWHLGTLMIGVFRSSALRFERTGDLIASGGLNHLLVQYYPEGGFTGDADGVPVVVRPGDIVVFDLARGLVTDASDFANITLLIPRAYFEAAVDDVGSLHGAVLPRDGQMAAVLASYLVAFSERLPALPLREADVAASATAALTTTVLSHCVRPTSPAAETVLSPFRAAAVHVDGRLRDPGLDAASIASGLGMSRATLYRVFKPVGGVAEYIRRRRLIAAAVDLSAPENRRRTIGEIGFSWGFGSEATFNRAFKAAFGVTPRAARERGSTIWAVADTGRDVPDEQEFVRWMRTLSA